MVRRTLSARIRDRDLVEDLTQETLARIAGADVQLSADEQRAYAVVTARNLLSSHFRGQSVRGRHLHRLVERGSADDPAEVTVDNEETAAMASALTHMDPADRELLMRHEVVGTDLGTLAGEVNVSRGAIAMRLARARAALRLEFLLAFRRMDLPTDRCRDVLLSLAVGDRRRQAQLDCAGHLARCQACSELVAPMTQRDRRIAGWLIVPVVEVFRRLRQARRRHPVWAASAVLLAGGTAGLVFASDLSNGVPRSPSMVASPTSVRSSGSAPTSSQTPQPTATSSIQPTVMSAPTAPVLGSPPATTAGELAVSTSDSSPPVASPEATAPATTVPSCAQGLTLDELDLATAVGCPFAVSIVTITEVSGTGEFSATTSAGRPVRVRLVGAQGALPVAMSPGLRVSLAGVVSSGPGEPLTVDVAPADLRLAG